MLQRYPELIPLGRLPVQLALLSNRTLAFVPVANFKPILQPIDHVTGDPAAYFFQDGFRFFTETEDEEFSYNTAYAYYEYPLMKRWLIQQNLSL